jgi:D-sedoheptulose 7-phosphate isomerase
MVNLIQNALTEHVQVIDSLQSLTPTLLEFCNRGCVTLDQGRCIYWMGNGGSATDSQHLAAELVGRFARERPGFASVALTTDSAILTSVSNDYGFEEIFARQIEALCQPNDLLIGLTTSGRSTNILRGFTTAAKLGVYCVGLTGLHGDRLADYCNLCLQIPSSDTARIQEAHMVIGHIFCDFVERYMAQRSS